MIEESIIKSSLKTRRSENEDVGCANNVDPPMKTVTKLAAALATMTADNTAGTGVCVCLDMSSFDLFDMQQRSTFLKE